MDNVIDVIDVLESRESGRIFIVREEDLKNFARSLLAEGTAKAKEEEKKKEVFLSKRDVLKLFGVCDTTLWHWEKSGFLIPRKVGRKIMYSKHDVDRCLAAK